MPGVPSGRACDACRKQKKKCDEVQPTCSRCQRLNVDCFGSGQRRFKFQPEKPCGPWTSPSKSGSSTLSTRSVTPEKACPPAVLVRLPSNDHTRLLAAVTDHFSFSANSDLRYSLIWAYGSFLLHVPKRIGTNVALDAAARALVISHTRFASGNPFASADELKAYSQALHVIRTALLDVEVARATNTLCAVLVLMLCQHFIGHENRFTGHAEGAVQILKAKGLNYEPADDFEAELLLTLRGPIIFEALANRNIQLSRQEWDILVAANKLDAQSGLLGIHSNLQCLAQFPYLLELFSNPATQHQVFIETVKLHKYSATTLAEARITYLHSAAVTKHLSPARQRLIYALNQRIYSLALFTNYFFNIVLRYVGNTPGSATPSPASLYTQLDVEADSMASETIDLAFAASQFRPLGSAFMTLFLSVAWAGANNLMLKARIEGLYQEYISDFRAMPPKPLGEIAALLSEGVGVSVPS